MSQCAEQKDHKPIPLESQNSFRPLDKATFHYYRLLYQSQNHMLVRTTKFFGRKSYRWFRLSDNDLLLYSHQKSIHCRAVYSLRDINFLAASPILKGFSSCIKLQIPKNPVYWLHFKNENEKFFFISFLSRDQKYPSSMVSVLVHNHTFNPQGYQQCMQVEPCDGDKNNNNNLEHHENEERKLTNRTSLDPKKPPELVSKKTNHEENVDPEIAEEGFVQISQLKVYSDVYVRPRRNQVKESTPKGSFINEKKVPTGFPNIEISKSDCLPNAPSVEAGATINTKDNSMLQFPITPLGSHSTKELNSKNSLKKISFSIEKTPERKGSITDSKVNDIGGSHFCADTSLVEDAEEIVRDWNKGIENVNSIRMMEFNGVGKRKVDLFPYPPKNEVYRKIHSHIGGQTDLLSNDPDPKNGGSGIVMTTSRIRDKVIGPRVLMNDVGPAIDRPDEDQDVENSSVGEGFKEEFEDRKVLFRLFSGELNKKVAEIGEKSHLSISLIDPKVPYEFNFKDITSVEMCLSIGHRFMWNFELEQARKCFAMFIEKDLLVELMDIESSLIEIAISGCEKKIKRMLARLQEVMGRASSLNISQKEPEKYFANELHKAEIYTYRGAMHFFLGNKFQTIKAFAEGWRQYRKLENLAEKKAFKENISSRSMHRFRFGHGCFNLIFSLIPPGLLKFMKIIGIMNPTKAKGLESLEICRKEDDIRSNYAAIVLAFYTLEFEAALEKACDIMRDCLETYNKCPLFHWISSIICWKFAQAKDACFMIKTALWQLKENSEEAVYLIYELGWFHFVNMTWDKSLVIFQKIICKALPKRFFQNQVNDITALAKSLKLPLLIDFSTLTEEFNDLTEEKTCILPHLPHIAVKIAACYFNLEKYELAIKWLLSTILIFRSYSTFKSRYEEDFSKLALKFLKRCSMKMLSYEVIYLMRYLPKMPDENLSSMLEQVEAYQHSIAIDTQKLDIYLASNSKEDPFIIEYFSSTMIRIINYCLLGDTDIACRIYEENNKYLSIIPEEFNYFICHIEYWVARAMVSENRSEEAKAMLKALLKRKKCDFSINTRIRRVLADIK